MSKNLQNQYLIIGNKSDRSKVKKNLISLVEDQEKQIIEADYNFVNILTTIKQLNSKEDKIEYWKRYESLIIVVPVEYKIYDTKHQYIDSLKFLLDQHTKVKEELVKSYNNVKFLIVKLYSSVPKEFEKYDWISENNKNALQQNILLASTNVHLCVNCPKEIDNNFTKEDNPTLHVNEGEAIQIITGKKSWLSIASLIVKYNQNTLEFFTELYEKRKTRFGFFPIIIIDEELLELKIPSADNFHPYIVKFEDFKNLFDRLCHEGAEQTFSNFGFG